LLWQQILQPAIDLAEKGVVQTEREARGLNAIKKDLAELNPGTKYFINPSGKDWVPGDMLIQKDLGKVLRQIQKKGRDGFYKGKVAKWLVKDINRHKEGIISKKDLTGYQAQ